MNHFNKKQMSQLKESFMNNRSQSLRLKADQVKNLDADRLTKRQQNKLVKAGMAGKGASINLDPRQIEKIIMTTPSDGKVQSHSLGKEIYDSPLGHALPKEIYKMVSSGLKQLGKVVPRYSEAMRFMLLTLLSMNPDFIKTVKESPSESDVRNIIRIIRKGQSGEGFFDTVKDLTIRGLKGLYRGVKAVANGAVNIIKNTGLNIVDKMKKRFVTKEGIIGTLGEIGSAAYTGFQIGQIEGALVGIATALVTTIGKDIATSFTDSLGQEFENIFKSSPKKEVEPTKEEPTEEEPIEKADTVLPIEDSIEDDKLLSIVGSGKYAINRIMNQIIR